MQNGLIQEGGRNPAQHQGRIPCDVRVWGALLEKETEASQETGLREENFEGRGEVMIPERNKQKKTYPAEHMPRAWNRKQDSSFRFLCYQPITVKPAVEHLAPS